MMHIHGFAKSFIEGLPHPPDFYEYGESKTCRRLSHLPTVQQARLAAFQAKYLFKIISVGTGTGQTISESKVSLLLSRATGRA